MKRVFGTDYIVKRPTTTTTTTTTSLTALFIPPTVHSPLPSVSFTVTVYNIYAYVFIVNTRSHTKQYNMCTIHTYRVCLGLNLLRWRRNRTNCGFQTEYYCPYIMFFEFFFIYIRDHRWLQVARERKNCPGASGVLYFNRKSRNRF